jgi:hypothetical protein
MGWLFGKKASDDDDRQDENEEENRHAAVSEKNCQKMAKDNNWELKRVEPTSSPILKVDCVFKGPQTSFQDDWYDNQD